MKRLTLSLLLGLVCINIQAQVVERFIDHTSYLASDELMGRGTGSKSIHVAAEYIAEQFQNVGLKPYRDDSYLQSFAIPGVSERESNVIGVLAAKTNTNRSIVFTAHYDAYGVVDGEIYNGARDNAIGVAALIELARSFEQDGAPDQNLVFIATAAEEGGQDGIRYYVNNPLYPLDEITININIDGFNVSGPREDYFVMPRQGVNFIDKIEVVASSLGWSYVSPEWIDGLNTSFDTSTFLWHGIPAFTLWTGDQIKGEEIDPTPEFGFIHTADDEINETWNWGGVEDHLMLYKAIAEYFIQNPSGISVTDKNLFYTPSE